MAEQQLIDYIKKTRSAGQADDQTKNLLYQNGWSKQEVSDAFLALGGGSQPISSEPKIRESYTSPASASPDSRASAGKPALEVTARPQMTDMTGLKDVKRKSILPAILVSFVILILVVGAAGAGWMLYAGIWSPSWSPFKLTSEKVLANMTTKMATVKSFGSKANFQITVPNGSISIATSGSIDATISTNLKTSNEITATFTQKGSKSSDVSAKFSAISIGNNYYIKMDSLALPASSNIDITAVKGKWLKVNTDSVQSILTAVGTSDFGVLNQVSQQSSKIADAAKNLMGLAVFSSDLGDTTLEGVKTYHYLMKVDKAKIKSFVTQMISATTGKSLIAGIADNVANLVGDLNMEIWIGKKDFMVYDLKVDKALNFKEFTSIPNATSSITLVENMSYPEINPPITVPANPQDAKVALLPIFNLQATRNALSQLGTTALAIFTENTSYASLCNRSLLNGYQTKYGSLLISLNNGIVARGAVKPVCFADKENFCISTQLANKSWLCINKKGIIGKVECTTATTDCK